MSTSTTSVQVGPSTSQQLAAPKPAATSFISTIAGFISNPFGQVPAASVVPAIKAGATAPLNTQVVKKNSVRRRRSHRKATSRRNRK